MSFKKFSAIQDALSNDKPADKSEDAPTADLPVTRPEKTPAKAALAPKS
jgi:hypothetical protein